MKLALVCPHFPPDRCGVGDYTALLARELASTKSDHSHSVWVWTAQAAPRRFADLEDARGRVLKILPVISSGSDWGFGSLRRIGKEIAEFSPDAVLIQFTPYLYGPNTYGLSPSFLTWVAHLRSRLKVPIILTVHELHYPVGIAPDRLFVGGPQAAQFAALACLASQVWFTYEVPLLRYRAWMPWQREKFAWIPVGANVDPDCLARPIQEKEFSEVLRLAKVPERHRLLVQFGSSHPSRLFPHSFLALDLARKEFGPDSTSLVFVGMDSGAVDQLLEKCGRMDLRPFARGTGYLNEWQVSVWLRRADVALAPFVDGVSTRRGSVMAALAHGTPVVTTRGVHTDLSLAWNDFTACVDAAGSDAAEKFAGAALNLLRDRAAASSLGERGRSRYLASFSWPSIARQAQERIGESKTKAKR